ncbi:MAG: LacI family DNA-binding transcriptional regulator [Chitinophagaceae bacterium]|nr:LacI family DNA-binding transcriptional regulator [Chitinophagaceae bacterium]
MGKKLSLNDIAKELNISTTTVSIVLNGKAKERRISPALVEKVLKLVEQREYKINLVAKSLRTGKSKIIGLFVEDISNSFFAQFARQIEEKAYSSGYKIIYCSTNNDTLKTKELLQIFKSRQVDGYIITPPKGIEEDIRSLIDSDSPVVLFDRYFDEINTHYVAIDNASSTHLGIAHLIGQGYRKIAFITIISEQTQMTGRLDGYRKCIKEHHLEENVIEINRDKGQKHIVQRIKGFLQKNRQLDSIMFSTNFLTMQGLKCIKDLKLRIPQDLGILSFDDNEFFELYQPTITAIAQPIEELSSHVIKILLADLASGQVNTKNYQNIVVPGSLIIRDSTIKRVATKK